MSRGPLDIKTRIERQEKKILKLSKDLKEAQDEYEVLVQEQKKEDQKRLFEAYQKSKRSFDEVMDFLKGRADI